MVLQLGICASPGDTVPALVDFQLGPGRPLPGTNVFPVFADGGSTLGWSFSVAEDIDLLALGFYDAGRDGLAEPHLVGLWSADGTMLASAEVAGGVTAQLMGAYRYAPVATVRLQPNTEYVIGATVPLGSFLGKDDHVVSPDHYPFYNVDPNSLLADPRILLSVTGLEYQGQAGVDRTPGPGELTYPADVVPGEYFLAPNLLFSPVPEPASVALLSIVLITTVARGLSSARQRNPQR